MPAQKYTIKDQFNFIRTEIINYYPAEEVTSMIFLILQELLGYSRAEILAKTEEAVPPEKVSQIRDIIKQLKAYKPIQYIFGRTEFYGMPFYVNEDVLIPRPETEELTDWIIREHGTEAIDILDVGTGSGCIAVALARHIPGSRVYAVDISSGALKTAMENARLNHASIQVLQMDMAHPPENILNHVLPPGDGSNAAARFDLIVSNPPYIPEGNMENLPDNIVNYEPHLALFVKNDDPLLFYKYLIQFSDAFLAQQGRIYVELHESHASDLKSLFEKHRYQQVELKEDINQKPRMLKAVKPPQHAIN